MPMTGQPDPSLTIRTCRRSRTWFYRRALRVRPAGSFNRFGGRTSAPRLVDGLAFSNASSPDYVVGLARRPRQLVIFGSASVEFWDLTGSDDEPFHMPGAGPTFADASPRVTRSW